MEENTFFEWSFVEPPSEYLVRGRHSYLLDVIGFDNLTISQVKELNNLEEHITKFDNIKEEEAKFYEDLKKKREEPKQDSNDDLTQQQRINDRKKLYEDHKDDEPVIIDDLKDDIEAYVTASKNLSVHERAYQIHKYKKLIESLDQNFFYEGDDDTTLEYWISECIIHNYKNLYIKKEKIRKAIQAYMVCRLKEIETLQMTNLLESSKKRKEKQAAYKSMEKKCECCNITTTNRNWAVHVTSQKHQKNSGIFFQSQN